MDIQILIHLDNPSNTFRPGDVMSGYIRVSSGGSVTVNKELMLNFHGFGTVHWAESMMGRLHQNRPQCSTTTNGPGSPFFRQVHDDYEHHRLLNHDEHEDQYHGYNNYSSSSHTPANQSNREYRNEETYLIYQTTLPLNSPGGKDDTSDVIELPAGHNQEIPFTFKLPLNIPSSCRLSHGSIHYFAKASLQVKKSHLVLSTDVIKSTRREFDILGIWDLEQVQDGAHLRPFQLQKQRQFGGILCLCCCTSGGQGEFGMNLRLARTGFVAGESITFHLNFRNESRIIVKEMLAELTQVIKFITFDKERKEDHTINKLSYNSKIMPGSNGTWSDELKIPQTAHLTDLGGSQIIRVKYILSVTARASLCRTATMDVSITIGTVPERGSFRN